MTSVLCSSLSAPTLTSFTIQVTLSLPQQKSDQKLPSRPRTPNLAAVPLVSLLQPQGQLTRGYHPALCVAQLDRAGLQVRERRARVGGLPGPRRHRHPPALAAGLRGLQLLLVAGRARRTLGRAAPCSHRIEAYASRPCRSAEEN